MDAVLDNFLYVLAAGVFLWLGWKHIFGQKPQKRSTDSSLRNGDPGLKDHHFNDVGHDRSDDDC
jgi:threonine/homoserine/homoserine lactone efflux protein